MIYVILMEIYSFLLSFKFELFGDLEDKRVVLMKKSLGIFEDNFIIYIIGKYIVLYYIVYFFFRFFERILWLFGGIIVYWGKGNI